MLKLKLLAAGFLLIGLGLPSIISLLLSGIVFLIIKTPGHD